MKLNKKVIDSITVCGLCAMLTVTAVTNSGRSEVKAEDKVLANTGLEHTGYNSYEMCIRDRSIGGSAVSIRKFPEHPMSMERLVEIEALSPEVARLLQILTQAKYNIFISGGTGSGKTTFLNALSQYIPDDERIITIEDSAELQLLGAKNIVRLETRNANTDGVTPITIRDLIRTALRMSCLLYTSRCV